jgi:ankyrin repeat protein
MSGKQKTNSIDKLKDKVLYSGNLYKKARTSVLFGRRWTMRHMRLMSSKKIEYYDGDSKRGDISLQGRVTIKEMSLQEADGQMHAFEISNEIKYDNPLLVSASSASEKEKWLKYIRKVIAGETWDTIASSGRIAEHIGSMPFSRKNKVFSDVETIAIISEIQRNHAFTLDTSTRLNTAHVVSVLYPTGVNRADTGKSLQEYATMRKHSKKRSESLFETMAAANDVNRRQCCESGSGSGVNSAIGGAAAAATATADDLTFSSTLKPISSTTTIIEGGEEEDDEGASATATATVANSISANAVASTTAEEAHLQKLLECCEKGDAQALEGCCNTGTCSSSGTNEGRAGAVVNSFGVGTMHVAGAMGQTQCIKVLLKHGVSTCSSSSSNNSNSNRMANNMSTTQQQQQQRISSPLHVTASWGHEGALKALLENGAGRDIHTYDKRGCTPLHVAAQDGHDGALRLLLDCDCGTGACVDVNQYSLDGYTPLHFASVAGSLACVQLLLERGADVTAQALVCCSSTEDAGEGYVTVGPLHLAAEYGHAAVLRTLFEHTPNVQDRLATRRDLGWTAAHFAALADSQECLQACEDLGLHVFPSSSSSGGGGGGGGGGGDNYQDSSEVDSNNSSRDPGVISSRSNRKGAAVVAAVRTPNAMLGASLRPRLRITTHPLSHHTSTSISTITGSRSAGSSGEGVIITPRGVTVTPTGSRSGSGGKQNSSSLDISPSQHQQHPPESNDNSQYHKQQQTLAMPTPPDASAEKKEEDGAGSAGVGASTATSLCASDGTLLPPPPPGSAEACSSSEGTTTTTTAVNASAHTDQVQQPSQPPPASLGVTITTGFGSKLIPPNPMGEGCSPLQVACFHGKFAAAEFLLQLPAGALTTTKAQHYRSVIASITVDAQDKLASALRRTDTLGRTALHYCAMGDQVDLLERLLELCISSSGVMLATEDKSGFTPLLLAIMYTQSRVVYSLVSNYGQTCERDSSSSSGRDNGDVDGPQAEAAKYCLDENLFAAARIDTM